MTMTNEERAKIMRQARANVVALKSLSQLQTEVVTELPAESERAVTDLRGQIDRLRNENNQLRADVSRRGQDAQAKTAWSGE
jgi:hypothetical protein